MEGSVYKTAFYQQHGIYYFAWNFEFYAEHYRDLLVFSLARRRPFPGVHCWRIILPLLRLCSVSPPQLRDHWPIWPLDQATVFCKACTHCRSWRYMLPCRMRPTMGIAVCLNNAPYNLNPCTGSGHQCNTSTQWMQWPYMSSMHQAPQNV